MEAEPIAASTQRVARNHARSRTRSLMRLAGLAGGLSACGSGLAIARSDATFPWLPPELSALVGTIFTRPDSLIVGGGLAIFGAIVAAAACRSASPVSNPVGELALPRWRRDRLAIVATTLAALVCLALYATLAAGVREHWQDALFLATLLLGGIVAHRLDPDVGCSRLEHIPRKKLGHPCGTSPTIHLDRHDVPVAVIVFVAALCFGSIELVHWRFAFIGDEPAFFEAASRIAWGEEHWSLFNLLHVYGSHPTMDSLIQAIPMKLMGPSVWSWRWAEIGVTASSSVLLYLLGATTFGRVYGVAAALLFAASHYLMALERVGYNNTHALMYATLTVLMLVLAWQSQRAVFLYATGLAAGLCLYTFQEALFTWPIAAIAIGASLLNPRTARRSLAALPVLLIGFALTVVPALIATPPSAIAAVAIEQSVRSASLSERMGVFAGALTRSPVILWDNDQWKGLYVTGPLLDPITGALLLVGLVLAIARPHHHLERLLVVWVVAGFVLTALTAHTPNPSLTRLPYVLPPVMLLAALGLVSIVRAIMSVLGLPRMIGVASILGCLAVAYWLNLYQLFVESPPLLPQTRPMMVIRALQEHPALSLVQIVGEETPYNAILTDAIAPVVGWYPWLSDGYVRRNANSSDIPSLSAPGPAGPTAYLVIEGDVVAKARAERQLPPGVRIFTIDDPVGKNRFWIYAPRVE